MEEPALSRRAFLRAGALAVLSATALDACGDGAKSARTPTRTTHNHRSLPPPEPTTAPTSTNWRALAASLTGRLVLPTSAAYAASTQLYNLRFESVYPAAIAYCATPTDVQRVIEFARSHAIRPTPRSGGHSYGGYSTGSGLIVDVSAMNAVAVTDAGATVGAGTQLVDLYAALASHNVLLPGGTCPTVGIAGLALGGGVGVLGRRYGLTCDAIRSLQLVSADGRLLEVDASHEPDLFWASRGGGGGNFGVVTSFTFDTFPVPPLAHFTLEFPWQAAGELLAGWTAWVAQAPQELWSNCLLLSAGASGLIARATGVYVGDTSPLAQLVRQLTEAVGATPTNSYVAAEEFLKTMLLEAGCAETILAQCHLTAPGSAGTLPRSAYAAKSAYFADPPSAAAVSAMTSAVERFHSELPYVGGGLALDAYGAAINAVAAGATAFVHRDAVCQVQMSGSWGSGSDMRSAAAVASWLSDTAAALAPYANGQAYQNYIDPTLADWPSAYYATNLPRLRIIKRAYDPDSVFTFAQSIPPA